MFTRSRRTLAALAIFAVLLGSACDQATTLAPDVQRPTRDLTALTATGTAVAVNKLVTYVVPEQGAYFSKVIGKNGGRLIVTDNKSGLVVPRGAVDQDVMFAINVLPGDTLHFSLTATRVSDGMPYGLFQVPVTLNIAYADLNVTNETGLLITFLADGTTSGDKIGLPSKVDKTSRVVSAQLIHFSDYALGEN